MIVVIHQEINLVLDIEVPEYEWQINHTSAHDIKIYMMMIIQIIKIISICTVE